MKSDYKIIKTPEFKKFSKAVLIEGLPGIGNVSRIVVDFLIEKLGAKKLCEVYSSSFPNSVMVTDESSIKMFKIEFHHVKAGKRDLILLVGDIQPSSDKESYELSEFILDLSTELGASLIITLGGAGLGDNPDIKKVHGVVTNDSFIKELKGLSVVFDGNETIKLIVGAAGLLLGLGKLRGIEGFALLVETLSNPQHVGIKESREVLKVLIKYLSLSVTLDDLDKEIKDIEEEIKAEHKFAKELRKQELMAVKPRYIG